MLLTHYSPNQVTQNLPRKKEKEPVEGKYTTIKLPNDIVIDMDKLVGKHGYKSRTEVVKDALRDLLNHYQTHEREIPRFEHFNIGPDSVRISDRKLNWIADIYFKPEGIFCDYDKTNNCEHIDFALTVPEIIEIIRKRRKEGWLKLPDV
jgi:Arc/MetJ-type ribon-helix-helix transcriptional regulator